MRRLRQWFNRWVYSMRRRRARAAHKYELDDPRHPLNYPSPVWCLFRDVDYKEACAAHEEKYGK